jgi:hypothetical protein
VLDAQTPAPAPLPRGASVADARGFALALPIGIVVVDRQERSVRVFRDDNFAVPQGQPIDVALTPSLTRAAWLCGGTVCWADLRASDVPEVPAPEAPLPGGEALPMPPSFAPQDQPQDRPEPSAPAPATPQ